MSRFLLFFIIALACSQGDSFVPHPFKNSVKVKTKHGYEMFINHSRYYTGYKTWKRWISEDDAEFEPTPPGQMRVSEIKAELELRGIGFADCFEKEELVQRLEKARSLGKADTSILDDFNRMMMEKNLNGEGGLNMDDIQAAAEEIKANDGTLPGGLTPEAIQTLASDPEIMVMLQSPRMQEVMKKVMQDGPSAMAEFSKDPEMLQMLGKLSGLMQKLTG